MKENNCFENCDKLEESRGSLNRQLQSLEGLTSSNKTFGLEVHKDSNSFEAQALVTLFKNQWLSVFVELEHHENMNTRGLHRKRSFTCCL